MTAKKKGYQVPCPGGCGGYKWRKAALCSACRGAGRPAAGAEARPAPLRAEAIDVKGDTAEVTKTTSENIRTLEDLIRVCEIDTDEWEIERWVCNKWESAAVPRATGSKAKGWERDSTTPIVTPLFQVKAWLRRPSRIVQQAKAIREGLLADIRAAVRKVEPRKVRRRFVDSDWLFEFTPFDLHLGKLTWEDETVANYDSAIAADLFDASLEFLLGRALKLTDGRLSRVLCVFGNDVSHVDSKRGETTYGTRMDVDGRYVKVYRRIVAIHRRAIDRLREVAPVDVKVIPGNHDELTSFHLGEVLSAIYERDKHVNVDNGARLRKYYDFGINLFGFTHGDSERVEELPLLMAREVPELWAKCSSREWHIGHKHIAEKKTWSELVGARTRHEARGQQDLFSDKGVRVRRLASLTAHDFWHTQHAYTDRRACDAFVFHREAGFTDQLSFNVDHFTGKALSK